MKKLFKAKLLWQIIASCFIATLATAAIVSAATTIGTNISTSGNLSVTSTTATSTFSTGGLTVGTSQFVVQQTSGNVGIGTTSPSTFLNIVSNSSIEGSIKLQNTFSTVGTGGGTAIHFDNGVTASSMGIMNPNRVSYGAVTAGSTIIYTATAAGIVLMADGGGSIRFAGGSSSESMRISSTGNVGIGTTTPNSLLNIASTLPRFYLSDTDFATNGHWFMENDAGVFSLGTTSSALAVSVTRALSITNAGNVGIGTSSPASLLHVSAGANATTTVEFGAQSVTSKTCFNVRDALGAATSFYFVGTTMIVEANRCR